MHPTWSKAEIGFCLFPQMWMRPHECMTIDIFRRRVDGHISLGQSNDLILIYFLDLQSLMDVHIGQHQVAQPTWGYWFKLYCLWKKEKKIKINNSLT